MDSYSRRKFLKLAAAGTAGLSLTVNSCRKRAGLGSERPNILFIAVDDLRPQIGCYGHKQMISPNIDRIAGAGTVFERAFCQVPVCGASRASLMSGVRPTRDRFLTYYTRVDEDKPDVVTLPKQFRDHGYHTISNGKIYHHRDDDISAWSEEPWRCGGEHRYLLEENKKRHQQNQIKTEGKGPNSRGPAFEAADIGDDQYPDHIITEKSIADLRRLKNMDEPFFLGVGFIRPHLPFNTPKKYWDMYKHDEIDLADNPFRPEGAPDVALHNWGELRAYADIPKEGPVSDETARNLIHGYYASVTFVDAQIGRLLDELDRLDLRENTMIILWGDHGWNLGEHGLWCKHCNFETSLHSPLIISAPGYKNGQRTGALTEFVDIYPSLCELCGLQLPEHLEGTSFVPLMKKPNREWKKAAFSRWFAGESIRTDRYRYTEWTNKENKQYARMLYDHQIDPMENVNVSESPEYAEIVQKHSGMLKEGWKSVKKISN